MLHSQTQPLWSGTLYTCVWAALQATNTTKHWHFWWFWRYCSTFFGHLDMNMLVTYAQEPKIVAIFTLKHFLYCILTWFLFLYSNFCDMYCLHIFPTNSDYYNASGHFYYWVLLQFPWILIILNGVAYYAKHFFFLLNDNFEFLLFFIFNFCNFKYFAIVLCVFVIFYCSLIIIQISLIIILFVLFHFNFY